MSNPKTPSKKDKTPKAESTGKRTSVKDITASTVTEGYKKNNKSGLYTKEYVKPTALKKGFEKVKDEINEMIDEIINILSGNSHNIKEVELSVSFDAKGKFLGIGIGGSTSIKIKIEPSGYKK